MNTIKEYLKKIKWQYGLAIVVVVLLVYLFISDKTVLNTTENGLPSSIDQDLLASSTVKDSFESQYPATSTRYTDTKRGINFIYTNDIKLLEDKESLVFSFHDSYKQGNSIRDAKLTFNVSDGSCSLWLDGENSFNVSKTQKYNNINFEIRNVLDSTEKDSIYEKEYSTFKNNKCYRILYAETQEKSQDLYVEQRNSKARESMLSIVDKLLQSFSI